MLRSYRDRHWSPSIAFGELVPKLTTGRLVDYMGQWLPLVQSAAVRDGFGQVAPHGVGGVPGDVRREHHVVPAEQWVVRCHGSPLETVDPRCAQPSGAQRGDQRLLVDDGAA